MMPDDVTAPVLGTPGSLPGALALAADRHPEADDPRVLLAFKAARLVCRMELATLEARRTGPRRLVREADRLLNQVLFVFGEVAGTFADELIPLLEEVAP